MNAKKNNEEKLREFIQPLKSYENLTPEAQKYEKIYLNYIKEMEQLGKNWRIAQNRNLSKKLDIPNEILLEIKKKYLSYTHKMLKAQKRREFLNKSMFEEI